MSAVPHPGPGAVLAVCGLAVEKRIADGLHVRAVAGGGQPDALAAAIRSEIGMGAVALISFGIAGGLDPSVVPGTLVVASVIVGPSAIYPVHDAWSRALMRTLPRALYEPVAASDVVVADEHAKASLLRRSDAVGVDMESHIAASIAQAHGLPFVALRAIADPAHRSLPHAAMVAMRPDGGIDFAAVFRSIARHPGQIPDLIGIGADTRVALRRLGDARRRLGRGLGYLDLDQLAVDVV